MEKNPYNSDARLGLRFLKIRLKRSKSIDTIIKEKLEEDLEHLLLEGLVLELGE